MSDTTSPRVSPTAPDPELTENVTVLMRPETRAFILGTRAIEGARSEGAVVRALIESAITAYKRDFPKEFETNMRRGLGILAGRQARS